MNFISYFESEGVWEKFLENPRSEYIAIPPKKVGLLVPKTKKINISNQSLIPLLKIHDYGLKGVTKLSSEFIFFLF